MAANFRGKAACAKIGFICACSYALFRADRSRQTKICALHVGLTSKSVALQRSCLFAAQSPVCRVRSCPSELSRFGGSLLGHNALVLVLSALSSQPQTKTTKKSRLQVVDFFKNGGHIHKKGLQLVARGADPPQGLQRHQNRPKRYLQFPTRGREAKTNKTRRLANFNFHLVLFFSM